MLEDAGDELGHEQRRYLRIVRREAERALRLAGELLSADALEHGARLDVTTVDLGKLAAECVEAMLPRAVARAQSLEVDIEAAAVVAGDRARLAQMIDNLVGNALQHTPAGGEVVVSVGRGAGGAWLAVRDTGPGLPAGAAAEIFDRFARGPGAGQADPTGSGLGLAIVKGIVEAHGGTVMVESSPLLGAIFVVEGLPLAEPGRPTALVVDDSLTVRRVAETVLRDAGWTVLAVATPSEALAHADGYDGAIDLVVSDLVLPEMDGLQLLRRLRRARPGIASVLCSSALPGSELLDSLGAVYVAKPFTAQSLLAGAAMAFADASQGGGARAEAQPVLATTGMAA